MLLLPLNIYHEDYNSAIVILVAMRSVPVSPGFFCACLCI